MYSEDKNVAAAQKVMLEILKEIHKVCVKNNITYWLDAGTLLGAVRHKGFIPWDDDCDISMPRTDYEKFIEIAQSELPNNMFLQTKKTDPESNFRFAKVRKLGTKLIESGETGDENYCHGIFVDIFPYDNYRYKWFVSLLNWHISFREKRKKYPKGSLKRFLIQIYTNIIMWIPVHIIGFIKQMAKKYSVNDNDYKWFTYGLECGGFFLTTRKNVLPVVLSKQCFENESFYVPQNSIAVVKANYGESYMKLPPEDKRKTHAKLIEIEVK